MGQRTKKILKWAAISVGVLVLAIGGWIAVMWFSAGGEYRGSLEGLLPSGPVLVVKADKPGEHLGQLTKAMRQLFEDRESFAAVEGSPLWKSLFATEAELAAGKEIPTAASLNKQIKAGLEQARNAVASIPVLGLTLEKDLLGKEAAIGLYGPPEEGKWLVLTRVSKSVDFGWGFTGFATGKQNGVVISKQGKELHVTSADGKTTRLCLLGDVLAISGQASLVGDAATLYSEGAGGGGKSWLKPFSSHAQYNEATAALEKEEKKTKGWLRLYSDLDAARTLHGPDPEDAEKRSKIDQYFSLPAIVLRLSPEIAPSINTVLSRAIDTRAFSLAAWAVDLSDADSIRIEQFLMVDKKRLDSKYASLKPAWSTPAAEMDFLSMLPEDTWLVGSNRVPFKTLRDSMQPKKKKPAKPAAGADGNAADGTTANPDDESADFVYDFLNALGPDTKVDAMGIALLGRSLSPDPKAPGGRDRMPPPAVSPAPLPGFAIFLHWPGVKFDDAWNQMDSMIGAVAAKNLYIVRAGTGEGTQFIQFALHEDNKLLRWLSDLACFAVKDYLVLSYSPQNAAVAKIAALSKASGGPGSLRSKADAPWDDMPEEHSALVYLSPEGLAKYARGVDLVKEVAAKKFDPSLPFDRDMKELREELRVKKSKEMGRDIKIADPLLDIEIEKMKRDWVAKRIPFTAEFEKNLGIADAFEDFTAVTATTTEKMHTSIVLRMK
jgi:hypothetical protein